MIKVKLVTMFILMIIINRCFADQKLPPIPIYTDSTQTITITQKSPEFIIQLKANSTTGYNWITKKYDKQLLTLVNYHYKSPSIQMPGAGGFAEWDFRAKPDAFLNAQTTTIHLLYARSWDLADHPTNIEFKVVTKLH